MILFLAAVLPVFILCFFVYSKDPNKEPLKLLLKIFFVGFLTAIPVIIVESILGIFFTTDRTQVTGFIHLFINVFMGVALVEEIFKWMVVKHYGYNSRDFDEIYDIIVYAVFSSLGFACIENILYVLQFGISVSVSRSIFSIPGHMCFGVLMGYYFSKAKLASVSNRELSNKNLAFSVLVPTIFHTLYDALIFYGTNTSVGIFYVFDFAMVILCVSIINKISKVQNNVKLNVTNGVIIKKEGTVVLNNAPSQAVNFCPVCGNRANGANFCSRCGMKLTK